MLIKLVCIKNIFIQLNKNNKLYITNSYSIIEKYFINYDLIQFMYGIFVDYVCIYI